MFSRHPAFKGREKQIGRYATKDPPEQEELKVGAVLQTVNDDLKHTVHDARPLSTKLVDGRTEKRGKDSTAQESSKEQGRNIYAIRKVEGVHMRSLHPISEHDKKVNRNVLAAKVIEIQLELFLLRRCHSFVLFQLLFIVWLVKVGTSDHGGEDTSHDEEELHCPVNTPDKQLQ